MGKLLLENIVFLLSYVGESIMVLKRNEVKTNMKLLEQWNSVLKANHFSNALPLLESNCNQALLVPNNPHYQLEQLRIDANPLSGLYMSWDGSTKNYNCRIHLTLPNIHTYSVILNYYWNRSLTLDASSLVLWYLVLHAWWSVLDASRECLMVCG